jgi:hypothetical protein
MSSDRRFEQDLPSLLDDLYLGAMPTYRDHVLRQIARTRQRPAWSFAGRWFRVADIARRPVLAARVPWRSIGLGLVLLALIAALVAALVVGGRPQANPTGQMSSVRANHTATLLDDGRVLVAGGLGTGIVPLGSAELYDPTSGAFSPTGSMTTARGNHTATLLPSGLVLIAGDTNAVDVGTGALASAELYDPNTGTFSPTSSMATARRGYTATLLADGRVLVAGGKAEPAELASAVLYDPKTGTFSPTGSMATAREGHTATLLPDGRVLVIGGMGDTTGLASAELYDPKTGTFSSTGSMTGQRVIHTATLLADGRVLVTGGLQTLLVGAGLPLASAEIYDPKSGTFSLTGSMATARDGDTATLLADGRVLVTGGTDLPNVETGSGKMLASAELYDPKSGTFSPTGSMTTARAAHTATLLPSGRVLVTGGVEVLNVTGPGPVLASAEMYDPKTGTFSPTGP